MTVTIQAVPSINAPTGVVMTGGGDQFWLLGNIVLASTYYIGVHMTGPGSVVSIDGTVQTLLPAVQVDGVFSSVFVGSNGVVRNTGAGSPAVYLNGMQNRLANDGLIDSAEDIAVFVQHSGNTVFNTGDIRAGLTGVYLSNTSGGEATRSTLENHGTIVGGISRNTNYDLSAGVVVNTVATIVNFGTISNVSIPQAEGAGIIVGVFIGWPNGGTTITNHGTVSSANNWGIDASRTSSLDAYGIKIVNTGLTTGAQGSIRASSLADTLQNSGTLSGDVAMGSGFDRLENAGLVLGNVSMGVGDDNFTGRLGSVTGVVLGDAGNDLLIGGTAADSMAGGADNDTLRGGDGDDSLAGDAGTDVVNGGRGDDYLTGGTGLDALLGGSGDDTIAGDDDDDLIYGGSDDDQLSGGNGLDSIFGDLGDDVLTGEAQNDRLYGGKGEDSLDGGTENDVIEGGAGNDTLVGGAGGDNLAGGAGSDLLRGGVGRDTLSGGADADIFVFAAVNECGVGATRDTITDFLGGIDRIDLSAIQAGQTFIGAAAFGNIAGQVRYDVAAGLLSGDTNGNGIADFSLQFAAGTVLGASDLIL